MMNENKEYVWTDEKVVIIADGFNAYKSMEENNYQLIFHQQYKNKLVIIKMKSLEKLLIKLSEFTPKDDEIK